MNEKKIRYFDGLDDRALVALLLDNNEEAIDYLFFHRCNDMFSHIVHSVFQSQGKKEELVTEFYLYLRENDWKKLRNFEFRSGLNTWLTVVSVRYFKKIQQNQTKNVAVEPQLFSEVLKDETDSYNIEDEMTRIELYKTIDKLSKPRERYALLAELAGKATDEIAADMNCSASAVYNLTKRARMELKKLLRIG